MHRFYLPPEQCTNAVLQLDGEEAHHALHVLRVEAGQRAMVLDGAGSELLCEILSTMKASVALQVRQRNRIPPLPFAITLISAVTKGRTMDTIVQKAAELGAKRLVPILAERTVAHIEDEQSVRKVQKWERVAIEAIKQCGSAWLPRIDPPRTPQEQISLGERFDLSLIASLQPGARHPREYLDRFVGEWQRSPRSVSVWVGPEGDFTPAESHLIQSSGAMPISLGPLVLRSETAAIYCLAVLNYELQSP